MPRSVRNLNPDVWRFRNVMETIADRRADIRLVPGWFHGVPCEIIMSVSRDREGTYGHPLAILVTDEADEAITIEPPHTI